MLHTNRLRALRKKRSLSQQEVAILINVSRQSYSMLENGYRNPSMEVLLSLAELFHVNIDYLVGRSDVAESFDQYSNGQRYVFVNLRLVSDKSLKLVVSIIKNDLESPYDY